MKKKIRAIKVGQFLIIHTPFKNQRESDELVRVKQHGDMFLYSDTVTEGTLMGMKFRQAFNAIDKKYFVQITDKETLRSMRIVMTKEEFKAFHMHGLQTIKLEEGPNANKS